MSNFLRLRRTSDGSFPVFSEYVRTPGLVGGSEALWVTEGKKLDLSRPAGNWELLVTQVQGWGDPPGTLSLAGPLYQGSIEPQA